MSRYPFQRCAVEGCEVGLIHPKHYGDMCAEHVWAEIIKLREALDRHHPGEHCLHLNDLEEKADDLAHPRG